MGGEDRRDDLMKRSKLSFPNAHNDKQCGICRAKNAAQTVQLSSSDYSHQRVTQKFGSSESMNNNSSQSFGEAISTLKTEGKMFGSRDLQFLKDKKPSGFSIRTIVVFGIIIFYILPKLFDL